MIPEQVYIVTSGDYSAYGISSVWLTEEEARAAAGDWGTVEVWPIGQGQRTLGTFSRSAEVDYRTGRVTEQQAQDFPEIDQKERADVIYWATESGIYAHKLGIRVTAATSERADKVYSEVKARVLACIASGLPMEAIADYRYESGRRDPWVPTGRV